MSSISELAQQWGNEQWAASIPFVERCVEEAEATNGMIVECGSGLTTLAMMRTGKQLVSLEHEWEWYQKLKAMEPDAPVAFTPILPDKCRVHDWYDCTAIPSPENVTLLVVDGPPGHTKGGRFGAVPAVWHALAPEPTIVLDDVHRFSELDTLNRWAGAFRMSGAEVQIEVAQGDRPFAVMKVSR